MAVRGNGLSRVTLPNKNTNAMAPGGSNWAIALTEQVLPANYSPSIINGMRYDGAGKITAVGNSGTPTAYVDVDVTFPDGITNQDFNVGDFTCLDPEESSKGEHSYPHNIVIYNYDANDLKAVYDGTDDHWEPVPVDVWDLDSSFALTTGAEIFKVQAGTVAYDEAGQRIFIARRYIHYTIPTNPGLTIIEVFSISDPDAPAPLPPVVPVAFGMSIYALGLLRQRRLT